MAVTRRDKHRAEDGLDLGAEMIKAGWSEEYVYRKKFQRLRTYQSLGDGAAGTGAGVWSKCNGDFHSEQ